MRKVIEGVALLILLAGCSKAKTVAEVGAFRITDRDVAYRNQLIRLEYPDETRDVGLKQLVDAYRFAEILRSKGIALDSRRLEEEANRIDANTKLPEQLAAVKKIFGLDRESYLHVYVLPVLATRVLPYEYFASHSEFQGDRRRLADRALGRVKERPSAFRGVAEELHLSMRRFVLDTRTTTPHSEPWLSETPDAWIVFPSVSRPLAKANVEAIVIPKLQFNEWLEREGPRVEIKYAN